MHFCCLLPQYCLQLLRALLFIGWKILRILHLSMTAYQSIWRTAILSQTVNQRKRIFFRRRRYSVQKLIGYFRIKRRKGKHWNGKSYKKLVSFLFSLFTRQSVIRFFAFHVVTRRRLFLPRIWRISVQRYLVSSEGSVGKARKWSISPTATLLPFELADPRVTWATEAETPCLTYQIAQEVVSTYRLLAFHWIEPCLISFQLCLF